MYKIKASTESALLFRRSEEVQNQEFPSREEAASAAWELIAQWADLNDDLDSSTLGNLGITAEIVEV